MPSILMPAPENSEVMPLSHQKSKKELYRHLNERMKDISEEEKKSVEPKLVPSTNRMKRGKSPIKTINMNEIIFDEKRESPSFKTPISVK